MTYLRATENVNGAKTAKRCHVLRSSDIGETFRVFTFAFFLSKLRGRINFPKIGNIWVAPPSLAVLDPNRGQNAILVHSGHDGYF